MVEFLLRFWYLWLIILILLVLLGLKSKMKGIFGEKFIARYLSKLPEEDYIVMNDIILPTVSGTTQIDHVVVSRFGIFVIETKNYKGWITGSESSSQWTQNIYGKKNRFMNPIQQNVAHVKAIESRLNALLTVPIIPIVAISGECDLKVEIKSHVVYFSKVVPTIRSYKDPYADKETMIRIAERLQDANIDSVQTRKEHVKMVKEKQADQERAAAGEPCPKCGGTLVLRKGKYGEFIGCSNYPKCRFLKKE